MRDTARSVLLWSAPAAALVLISAVALGAPESPGAVRPDPAEIEQSARTAPKARVPGAADPEARLALVERGAFLVTVGGCNDCHTPWVFDEEIGMAVPDMSRALTGHPAGAPDPASALAKGDMAVIGPTFTSFRLPFGVVYASNLTSHPQRGLGSWSAEQFVKAMRTGRHAGGGRVILPPMPWAGLAQLPDRDLEAIHAYLLSLPPSDNKVPVNQVSAEAQQGIARSYGRLLEKMKRAPAGE